MFIFNTINIRINRCENSPSSFALSFVFAFVLFRSDSVCCNVATMKEVRERDKKKSIEKMANDWKLPQKKKFELKKNTIIKEKKTILMKKMNIITELTEETWNEWRDDKRTTDTLDYPLHSAFKAKSFTFLPCFTQKRYCFSCQQCLKKRLLYLCWA